MGRKKLSKLYTSFIRPTLEYASIVWDGCSVQDAEKLEKVQLSAARIVTGLPSFASKESLYFETGWETLKARRYVAKMITMFKINTGNVPEYLCDIVPKKHENVSEYNTRNKDQFIFPRCNLELFKKSFVPDATKYWNSLSIEARASTSINTFRKYLTTDVSNPPPYFSFGKRYTNIVHTKLRYNCLLNDDLYKRNIVNTPLCSYGKTEDSYHFFFACKNYTNARNILFTQLFRIDLINIDTNLLLWGNTNLSLQTNTSIFAAVHKFIEDSCRFR